MVKRVLLFLLCYILLFSPACARDFERTVNDVTVAPAKFEVVGQAGQHISQSLKITNDSENDLLYAVALEDFCVDGENGEVILGGGKNFPDDILSWTSLGNKSGTLGPKETKVVNLEIDLPKEASPGGHYASIVVSLDRLNRPAGQSGASYKIVSVLMLSVTGSIRDEAKIDSFKVQRKKDNPDLDFELRVKNSGNNHIKPKGSVVVSNIFGVKVADIPLSEENVLPGMVRRIDTTWEPDKPLFGWYTAAVAATYGEKGILKIVGSTGFLILPVADIIVLIAIVLVLLVFLLKRRRTFKPE